MEKLKISICITVKNEEKFVGDLLSSLLDQTKKADEIVIVDGGSTDKTMQILRHFAKKDKTIKILKAPNTTIAQARNLGIEVSRGDIIATTDCGCIAKPDWLQKITQPFKHKSIGLVAGFYSMPYKNPVQEVAGVYMGVPPQRFDPLTFIPSARSVAFRKSVWENVGGFNEKLERGGEDTDFFYKCVKSFVKIARVEEAIVEWKEIETMDIKDIAHKFFVYAKGDGQAKIWWHPSKQLSSHNIKISTIYLRYILGILYIVYCILHPQQHFLLVIPVILVLLYLIWPIWKWRDVIKRTKSRLLLPIIQIISDIQVMRGFFSGAFLKN